MIDIKIIKCLSDNYSYLIRDKKTNLVGVIDPSEFRPVDIEIEKSFKKLDFVLNTHHHSDHTGGNIELKNKYNCKVVCSLYDEKLIPGVDIKKKDGETLMFGEINFKVIHIPGHTVGHIAFYSKKANIVFTGDTLFSLGCGRIFEGTFEQMFQSLEKLKSLPNKTLVYCGHEYTKNNGDFCISIDSDNEKLKERIAQVKIKINNNLPSLPVTLKDEIETNIFLRCDNKKIKNNLKMNNSSNLEVFTNLRNLKDTF
tara:strand:- start:2017 stop:2781 length:765 start_codon:yes stop_codon:yes gene_type:complete